MKRNRAAVKEKVICFLLSVLLLLTEMPAAALASEKETGTNGAEEIQEINDALPSPSGDPKPASAGDGAVAGAGAAAGDADVIEGMFTAEEDPAISEIDVGDYEESIEEFARTIEEFSASQVTVGELIDLISRFGGVVQFANGCVAVLEMIGIIKDPTAEALAEILSEVFSVEDKLGEMDAELKQISEDLEKMAADQEEKDRQKAARDLLFYWSNFNKNYREPLHDKMKEYEGYINEGILEWWKLKSHEGVWVLYTVYKDEISLTYSREPFSSGIPKTADNGETVVSKECIGLPGDYMPDTASVPFKIDSYDKTFTELITKAIVKAANDGKLKASTDFYANWKKLDDAGKTALAAKYAPDFLSTVIYKISCDMMSSKDEWVIGLINAYDNYCSNIKTVNSGIDALIQLQYVTHGFEGEVKDGIVKICDSMIAASGYYGIFALTAAGQDSMQSTANKQALQKKWSDTIQFLVQKKEKSLTGHDNYCYIAGALLEFETLELRGFTSSIFRQIDSEDVGRAYIKFNSEPLTLYDSDHNEAKVPPILNDKYSLVLYDQYLCQKKDDQSYGQYLAGNGVGITEEHYKDKLMTRYGGIMNFSLSDALQMKARELYGDYFKTDEMYNINSGNPSKIKNGGFVVHDELIWDYIDPETGEFEVQQVFAARAAYIEHHWYWETDEGHVFVKDMDMDCERETEKVKDFVWGTVLRKTDTVIDSASISMITVKKLPDDEMPQDGPLTAFDRLYRADWESGEDPAKEMTYADWSAAEAKDFHLNLYEPIDERLDDGISAEIDAAVKRAEAKGIHVELTGQERSDIAAKMKTEILARQDELGKNGSIVCRNVLGIDGNEEAELALAEKVLPGGYLDESGRPKIPAENIDTMLLYEPGAVLEFVSSGGKAEAVIRPAFEILPLLVVWDHETESFERFEISSDVMQSLGLLMSVRIPAGAAGDNSSVTVIHYDSIEDLQEAERSTVKVQGSGNDRYASVASASCSPFALEIVEDTPEKKKNEQESSEKGGSGGRTSADTGDENDPMLWIILMAAAIAALTAAALSRKRKY